MVLSLLYGKKYPQSVIQSNFGSVTFDTMVVEEHKYSSRVTHYPTEFGTIVSDHIIKDPDMVQLSGVISDTPLSILAPFNRSVAAFNQLVELHARRLVFDVVTGIKVYRNMAITVLDVPRTVKTGQTLTFNITLQKIIFVDTIQRELQAGNIFEGVNDNTPRTIVAENTNIPIYQSDPAFSLKDQASSSVFMGVQSLAAVPTAMLPQILSTSVLLGLS
jgi:hypothetical protein